MSLDKREDILARLFAIIGTVRNVNTYRNIDEISEASRPCIILMDGDETVAEGFTNKGGQATITMVMTPRIAIGVSSTPDDLGPGINAIRAKLLPAVLGDAALATILGTNGKITYDGLAGKLSQGSLMASDMELNFSIQYPLDIKALA